MSLDQLTKTPIETSYGAIPFWHLPTAFDRSGPVLIAISGAFADPHFLSGLPVALGAQADGFLMHLPGASGPALRETGVFASAKALDEAIAAAFCDRPVVLFAEGLGATVALAARGPQIRRLILAEPLLATADLWPLEPGLRRRFEEDPSARAFIAEVFGVTAQGLEAKTYLDLLQGVTTPADVWLGGEPLLPRRSLSRYPSLVDGPGRAALEAHPSVRLHVSAGAGHNVLQQEIGAIEAVLRSALDDLALPAPTQALLRRTPLTARRLLFAGEGAEAFEVALQARNPGAEVQAVPTLDAIQTTGPFAHVVATSLTPQGVAAAAAALSDQGELIGYLPALGPTDLAALRRAIALAGFTPISVYDPDHDDRLNDVAGDLTATFEREALTVPVVMTLRKSRAPIRRMVVQTAAYAPFRMDIRTRLPTEGLRTIPDLAVALTGAPAEPLDVPVDTPKIIILQRPSSAGAALWRSRLAQAIRGGWVSVIEFDDHPRHSARLGGGDEDYTAFTLTHAVQTSTPVLEPVFRAWNPEVKAFSNAAFDLAPFKPRRAPHRIFYGALRRGRIGMEVAASLGEVSAAFPDVEFVVVADREVFDAIPARRKLFYELQTYENYLALMSRCSISLSPVEDDPLQDAKSDTKFVDAASRGVLTIASPRIYRDTIRHGETGLIAETIQDWPHLIKSVLHDDRRFNEMAFAAWNYARSERMFAHQVEDRRAWYWSLWERREALTALLVERVPGLAEELRELR